MHARNIEDIYTLSPVQEGMLYQGLTYPDSGAYINQLIFDVKGSLDVTLFRKSWQRIIDRHPALRTSFHWEELRVPNQVVHRHASLPFEERDFTRFLPSELEDASNEFLITDRRRGFTFSEAPLMRITVLRLGEDAFRIIWSSHHIICDAWSGSILLDEAFDIYEALFNGHDASLERHRPYRDYISWLKKQSTDEARTFWEGELGGFPAPTPLPFDFISGESRFEERIDSSLEAALPVQATEKLRAAAKRHRLTLNSIVQCAWALLLERYSGRRDVVFGATISGRPADLEGFEKMVGLFINTLPVRIDLSGDTTLLPLLHRIQARQIEREQYSYSRLVDIHGWSDVPRGLPLFNTIVVFENVPRETVPLHERDIDLAIENTRFLFRTNYPLTLMVVPDERVKLRIAFDESLFEPATVGRMLGHLRNLIEEIAGDPEKRITEYSPFSDDERRTILVTWNDAGADYPTDRCIHELFEKRAAELPDSTAAVFFAGDGFGTSENITYGELDRRACRIANRLIGIGARPGTPVGIYMARSPDLVVSVLGVLKVGAAYVPLDPSYPAERLRYMIEDSGASVILTDRPVGEILPETGARAIPAGESMNGALGNTCEIAPYRATPQNTAYIIYTSGSTGRPKGVAMPHRGLVNLIHWQTAGWRRPRVLQLASLSFDVSFQEIFTTLCSGGTLVLVTEEVQRDPWALWGTITREAIERLFVPFVALHQLAEEMHRHEVPGGCLVSVMTAGEQLRVTPRIANMFRILDGCTLENQYGPTESHVVTSHILGGDPSDWPHLPPIGTPVNNVRIYLLDDELRPVPVGAAGELYIAGDALADGYARQSGFTAERFIPDPFDTAAGRRLYRTGDLARYRSDGVIEFIGRTDHQVKIRGYRIELQEIECALGEHPSVRETVVSALGDTPESRKLVAYVVPEEKKAVSSRELRRFLQLKLPGHMVPSTFVILDSLPLTPSGKVDRGSLPEPDVARPELEVELTTPRNPLEDTLVEIWRDVLGVEHVGLNDNFFELGGHSLLATQLVSRIRELFHVELAIRSLFESPTVAGLAERIEAMRRAEQGLRAPAVVTASRTAELPLSFAQERLWFLDQLVPDNPFYNIPSHLRLTGPIDTEALRESFAGIVARHEALRTNFTAVDGRPRQVIKPSLPFEMPVIDLSTRAGPDRDASVQRLATEESRTVFDLECDPLLRASLLRLGAEDHVLLLTMHHIVSDGWSIGVLLRELAILYENLSGGNVPHLPELPVQYADYAIWQREWLRGEMLERQLAYWKKQLAGAPEVLTFPTDRPRPAMQIFYGGIVHIEIPPDLTKRMKLISQHEGTSLFMTLFAAFAALLGRYTGREDVVIGSPIANRNRREIENLIGFFVNTMVLRVDLSDDPTYLDLLDQVRRVTLDAYDHQDLPFELLVEELHPARDTSHQPLVQVVFALQNAPMPELALPALSLRPLRYESRLVRFDLEVHVWETADALSCYFAYSTDLFNHETIERIAKHFQMMLRGVAEDPDARMSSITLLDDEERHRLLVEWNETESYYPREAGIHRLFEIQAERTPDSIAVTDHERSLTYRELNRQSNIVAHRLIHLGIGTETPVGICLERSIDMVIGILCILKAGGAYVPLDPAYPEERLRSMIEDSGIDVVIARRNPPEKLPAGTVYFTITDNGDRTEAWHEENPARDITADNLAYIMHTSGSTGRPKGVAVVHRGVTRLVVNQNYVDLRADDRILQLATLSFDASTFEIWGSLLSGGCLVLRTDPLPAIGELREFLQQEQITTLWLTAGLFHVLVEEGFPRGLPLRQLLAGGDVLSVKHVRAALGELGECLLVNGYGPTENTTFTCCHIMHGESLSETSVPIGRPVSNTRVYILDSDLGPVPVGVPGELYTGGDGLARGYFDHASMTALTYIPNPFGAADGERMYRTGDRARYLKDGTIEFLGRTDDQVKIRGYRIEPREIEAVLKRHPAVGNALVLCREERPGDKRLVAYITLERETDAMRDMTRAAERELVSTWKLLYEETYKQPPDSDPIFNTSGWISSYTGEPIPREEMHEWVTHTVDRIMSLHPDRVMEIGCGTGLLLSRIAPRCSAYTGTDFSPSVLELIETMKTGGGNLDHVILSCREADDFTEIADGDFDTVIINSATQYFPGIDYLLRVVEGAARAVKDGGTVFIGDVRSLPLLEAYHASVELRRAPSAVTLAELEERIRQGIKAEEELVVDPDLFFNLAERIPRIAGVRILLKRGVHHNEMTKFRYDVILHIGETETDHLTVSWADWKQERPDVHGIGELLAREKPDVFGLCGVVNTRLNGETAILERLGGAGTVGELKNLLDGAGVEGIDPEEFWRLGESIPYDVDIGWLETAGVDGFDVVFRRRPPDSPSVRATILRSPPPRKPLHACCNTPLNERIIQRLNPELREICLRALPEYMVPASVVILDEMPLSPSGKIDRRALPSPERPHVPVREPRTPAPSPVVELIGGIWADVLGIERVGIHDDFFELGGHSLLATQVISRMRDIFHVEFPLRSLFDSPTIAGLARVVEGARTAAGASPPPPIKPVPRTGAIPLSFAQQRLWFLDRLDPGNPIYNISLAARFAGPLDRGALERSTAEIVRRHESLRTTFTIENGAPVQAIVPPGEWKLTVVDLDDLPEAERETEAVRLAAEWAMRPFALDKEPPFRAALIRLDEETHVFLLIVHHIISDGWSMGIIHRELSVLYNVFLDGEEPRLENLPIQYADYSVWQRTWLQGEALDHHLSYWRRQLADIPLFDLPTDFSRPPVQTYRGGQKTIELPEELSEALSILSRTEGVTLFMTLLAAFTVLLSRHSGLDDIVVGCPVAGRTRVETEGLIGFFLNTLVLRTDISGDPSFRDLLRRVRDVTQKAYDHQDLPFEKLLEELQPERDLSRTPLFQIFFNMVNINDPALDLDGITVEQFPLPAFGAKFDVTLYVKETARRIGLTLVYNADLFTAERMEETFEQYRRLLVQAVENPGAAVGSYSLITPAAARILPDPTAPLPAEWKGSVEVRFMQNARERLDRPAVIDGTGSLSYGELDEMSAALSRILRDRGIGRGDVVGILARRSASLVWAVLGILKAGAAFLILDPAYPAARRAGYLRRAGARGLLICAGPAGDECAGEIEGSAAAAPEMGSADIPLRCRLVLPSATGEEARRFCAGAPAGNGSVEVGSDDLACVTFTSGSTGEPKGVLCRHGPLSHFLPWQGEEFGLGGEDRYSMLSGLSHDPLQREIFTPLWFGAAVCVPEADRMMEPGWLAEWMARERVTVAHLTPATAAVVCAGAADGGLPELRCAFIVGDVLRMREVERLRAVAPGISCVNLYGATETQRAVGYYVVPDGAGLSGKDERAAAGARPAGETADDAGIAQGSGRAGSRMAVPLGRGMAGAQLVVLNRAGEMAGIGEVGEISVRSPHLAAGYLEDPALTAERFVVNPFTGRGDDRMYRTGDLGRFGPDGTVTFAGRGDRQLTIRGFRIEPAEVESALREYPGIRECVAAAYRDDGEDPRLVAFYVSDDILPTLPLRRYLRTMLPDYMIPAEFVHIETVPLTPNGKVDYGALGELRRGREAEEAAYAPPRTAVEKKIAAIWRDALGRERIGLGDNFFDLGGHSLLLIQVIMDIKEQLDIELNPRQFIRQTLGQIAAAHEKPSRAFERN